jgi:hypothetical protein
MRRSEYDVTDRIQTTLVGEVQDEVTRVFRSLYEQESGGALDRSFMDIESFYEGRHADYYACDTAYHDIQHVLDVSLAMARLMDGYERGRRNGAQPLTAQHFQLGIVTALYHDFGYLRRRTDRRHRNGAEYTLTHVSRGSKFLRKNVEKLDLGDLGTAASTLIHYTGYERSANSIRMSDAVLQRIGYMLGTADIIAQMADRCYLEKCRDRLYPEFVLGGLARRRSPGGRVEVVFSSGEDLVSKTPGFYVNAQKRLDEQLDRVYGFAEKHFGGQNLYIEEMQKNVRYAQAVAAQEKRQSLRRQPPTTLRSASDSANGDLIIP